MTCSRRIFIQAVAVSCGAALGSPAQASSSGSETAASCDYTGPGLYLYPQWGSARPYLVTDCAARTGTLEFRDPRSQQLLWTQTLSLTGRFAGKLT